MRDPVNEEIHKYRAERARKFNFDLAAMCDDLRAFQEARGLKVVRLPPKRIGSESRSQTP